MSGTLVHRGPDSDGSFVEGGIGLAARRLSIIDLEGGDQPIANENGTVHVVQNGEIYNHEVLRRELQAAGHRFRTRCDTEVLVHLYEEHGDDFARRLRGMFAIAIWDGRGAGRLVLARDRFGIKPLLYRHSDGELAFASELRALPRGEVDLDALEAFLAFNSLAALAADESSEPLRTFSIGFEERSFDELGNARLVVERYGTRHRELVLRPDAALLLPALADAFDEPFADSSALPTYLVSRLAAEDVKVALSGEGGDELFGGYYTYAADLLAARIGGLARAARPLVELLPSSSARASFDYRAKRFVRAAHLAPLERHHAWKEIFSPDARAELTGRRSRVDPVELLRDRFSATEGAELPARLQGVDLGLYLVDDLLVKTDRASMAHSLEARVPFCDTMVSNLALALPERQKVRGLAKKVLLRRAAAPPLPR